MDMYPSWLGPAGEGDPYPVILDVIELEITEAPSAKVIPVEMDAVVTSQLEVEVTGNEEIAVSLPSALETDLPPLPEA